MKKMIMSAVVAGLALTGCNSMSYDNERTVVVDGESMVVEVVNIPSFEVEIDSRKAVCDVPVADGSMMKGECLQYRQPYQKNFNVLSGDIQGFTHEPGYRYILDVRQEAVADDMAGVVKPVWILNDVISATSEMPE